MTEAGKLIADIAFYYLGKYERPGNTGFYDEKFEKEMRSFGFQTGFSWCMIFAELCWRKAYRLRKEKENDEICSRLFSASVLATRNNFREAGFKMIHTPCVGALMIMQHGRTASGHTGIVVKVEDNYVETIEGNTNEAGGREGNTVAKKRRSLNFIKTEKLHLIGFIWPI